MYISILCIYVCVMYMYVRMYVRMYMRTYMLCTYRLVNILPPSWIDLILANYIIYIYVHVDQSQINNNSIRHK